MADAPFQMPGQTGRREQTGIVTWTIPWFVDSTDDVFTVGQDAPVEGLREIDRVWTGLEGTGDEGQEGLRVDITYEGYVGDDIEAETAVYEYDGSFSEEKLNAHPEWLEIAELYSGEYDEESNTIRFPETLDRLPKDLTFGLKLFANEDGKIKNPLFGLETFLAFSVIFRQTYIAEEVDEDLLLNVGVTVDELPAGFPTPSGRNWLFMPPKVFQRGDFFEITEELALSPIGGTWPESIYKFIEGTGV